MWDSKKASRICLGCVAFGGYDYGKIRKVDCINTIHAALDQGINTFDTAAIYGLGKSEEILGEALRKKREAILITKFGLFKNTNNETVRDLSPDKIPLQAEQSLRRLKRDFIDLYLIHWYDDKTPIDEVISQLVRLQKQGKIKAYGCSNFNRDLIDPIINHVHALQVPYSLGQNEYEDGLQKCHSHQQFTMAYNVLMRGLLTGKYDPRCTKFTGTDTRQTSIFFHPKRADFYAKRLQQLQHFANVKRRTMSQIAIAFTLTQPFVSCAVVGAKSPEQVRENIQSQTITLDSKEMAFLSTLFQYDKV